MFKTGNQYIREDKVVYDCLYADRQSVCVRREDAIGQGITGYCFSPHSESAKGWLPYKRPVVHERWIVWWQHGKEVAANVYATLQTKPIWDNDHPGLICLEIKKIIYEQKFHP